MNRKFQPALRRSATSTFELMGFLFATEEPEDDARTRPLALCGRVHFDGPFEGAVEVHLTRDLVPELAANMMGVDEAPDEATCRDAVGELVNVICGNLLPQLAGFSAVFDLAAPVVGSETSAPPQGCDLVAEDVLGVECGRAELRLWISQANHAGVGP